MNNEKFEITSLVNIKNIRKMYDQHKSDMTFLLKDHISENFPENSYCLSSENLKNIESCFLRLKNNPVFFQEQSSNLLVIKANCVYAVNFYREFKYQFEFDLVSTYVKHMKLNYCVGFLCNCKKNSNEKMMLLNADYSSSICLDENLKMKYKNEYLTLPKVSMDCLSQFFSSHKEFSRKIKQEELFLVDSTEEIKINFTSNEQKLFNRGRINEMVAPEFGYTMMSSTWHKSGYVLIQDTETDMFMLLGQDEGTYFGVELPCPCKTVKSALESLIPKEIRNIEYRRQGEWFVVAVEDDCVPCLTDSLALGTEIYLPVEDEYSNKHLIESEDIRVSRDGFIYAKNCTLTQSQHSDIYMKKGWFTFYKNTAVRSFSEEGVD